MSQPQSALLRLPAELRHDIYSYLLPDGIHAHLRGGKLNLSPCLEHSYLRRKLYLDGDERDPAAQRGWTPTRGYPTDTPTHLRRLESTWGPHWMCEEQSSESMERFDMTLALVCKSMYVYTEIIDLLTRHAVVHFTDFDTLNCLNGKSASQVSASPDFLAFPLSNVTQLSITLRLPLKFFQTLEQPSENAAILAESDIASLGVKSWLRLSSVISQLNKLTKLRLWLDYDEPGYWTVVNEKALLEPLLTELSNTKSSLEVIVVLPKLHPKYERGYRHFVDGKLPGGARLHRALRQSYWKDCGHVEHKPDFPFMLDMIEVCDWSLDEVEVWERNQWKQGHDMEREFWDMLPGNHNI